MNAADAIARATRQARDQMDTLNADAAEELRTLYEQIIRQLQADLRAYGDDQGNIRVEVLQNYLRQAQARLNGLTTAQGELLRDQILSAAQLGADIWGASGGLPPAALPTLADAAARFVIQFIAADGLQLSDRIWRIDQGAKQQIADTLRRNVILGRDASRAVAELLGQPIPPELQQQLGLDKVEALGKTLADVLTQDPNNAYSRALRVMRTELNRAHGEAYRQGAGRHPDVIGERFVLSPNHPRPDICDTWASADLYGMGPGIYPIGKAPWPAHPNTMSYLEAVFRDDAAR